MIIDLQRFLAAEREYWTQLEQILNRLDNNPDRAMTVEEIKQFHYLYQRASADLAKIRTFCSEPDLQRYVESLVARAYGEIHVSRDQTRGFRPMYWFFNTLPQTFRRHFAAFCLSTLITFAGVGLGAATVWIDPSSKEMIFPAQFSHLSQRPSERVRKEESATTDRLQGQKAQFSSFLMQNNIRVSILTLSLGMTFGVGTILELFYNGVILGAVSADYVSDGQTMFLLAWLLPHGAIEIPAILLAGQGGLVLAGALIGRRSRDPLRVRLRAVIPDLVTLIGGIVIMLVWAGIIEAFLSQYHAPVLPYEAKIAFGSVELVLLFLFLSRAGTKSQPAVKPS
ncbi:MAG TPA: stage II sporulation protein M [Planctomycetota bacterium]|nr:stage II sporulation protein M [Planctomycetota bacterium]